MGRYEKEAYPGGWLLRDGLKGQVSREDATVRKREGGEV